MSVVGKSGDEGVESRSLSCLFFFGFSQSLALSILLHHQIERSHYYEPQNNWKVVSQLDRTSVAQGLLAGYFVV